MARGVCCIKTMGDWTRMEYSVLWVSRQCMAKVNLFHGGCNIMSKLQTNLSFFFHASSPPQVRANLPLEVAGCSTVQKIVMANTVSVAWRAEIGPLTGWICCFRGSSWKKFMVTSLVVLKQIVWHTASAKTCAWVKALLCCSRRSLVEWMSWRNKVCRPINTTLSKQWFSELKNFCYWQGKNGLERKFSKLSVTLTNKNMCKKQTKKKTHTHKLFIHCMQHSKILHLQFWPMAMDYDRQWDSLQVTSTLIDTNSLLYKL